ncbi:MAG: hypothetical protein KF816_02860 [Melioribacteraceae bacterium]|nr:hypothetical protein [Melioribacteraceae bacterium]
MVTSYKLRIEAENADIEVTNWLHSGYKRLQTIINGYKILMDNVMKKNKLKPTFTDDINQNIQIAVNYEKGLTSKGVNDFTGSSVNPIAPDQVIAAIDWYTKFTLPAKTFNADFTSYYVKHRIEAHLRSLGNGMYISNGAVIAALLIMGIDYKKDKNSPNVIPKLKSKRIPLPKVRWHLFIKD